MPDRSTDIPLNNYTKCYGPLKFLAVRWESDEHRFCLLSYEINGEPAPLGLRMDADRNVILDDPEECVEQGVAIRDDAARIYDAVIEAEINAIGQEMMNRWNQATFRTSS